MPGTVDPDFAQWLRDPALFSLASNTIIPAEIAAAGVDTEVFSPLADAIAAAAEGVRQMEVLGGPLAIDQHIVAGRRGDLIAKVVALTNPALGYAGGGLGFVIDAEERDGGFTVLQVVKALGVPVVLSDYSFDMTTVRFDASAPTWDAT